MTYFTSCKEYNIHKRRGGGRMGETIYADLLFMIDFSMDFLTFYIVSRLLKQKIRLIRMCSASAMGGVYSVLSLSININRFLSVIFSLFVCFVMCMTAFLEKSPNRFRKMPFYTIVYFVVSSMLGGIMTVFFNLLNKSPLGDAETGRDNLSLWVFGIVALLGGLATMLGSNLLGLTSRSKFGKLTVRMRGKSITLEGMSDSGNLLKDPIGGKDVIVIDRTSAYRLVPELVRGSMGELTPELKKSIRMIPVRTASGAGLLTAFSPDEVTLAYEGQKKNIDVLIALSKDGFDSCQCEALIPAEYFT